MKRKIFRVIIILLLVLLLLMFGTVVAGAVAKSNLAKQNPAPGQLVEVEGTMMHINCRVKAAPRSFWKLARVITR